MINIKISETAKCIETSLARKLFNMSKNFDDVVDLTLGDPDFNMPNSIKQSFMNAINSNMTHYSVNAGLEEGRKAVAKHIKAVYKKDCDYQNEVILTAGGMGALFLSLASLVNPQDEVIIFSPYYVNYVQMTKMFGGVPIIINALTENGLMINKDDLEKKITSKSKIIIVNTPNNPTGDIFDKESLKNIAEVAFKYNLVVITDEVYRSLIFEGQQHNSMLDFSEINDRTILIDSLSKEYCMTGLRIGYAFGPETIISHMVKLQENVIACATVPSQCALTEVYNNPIDNSEILAELANRRDFLYSELSKINGIKCLKPKATFYMFVNIEKFGMSSLEFAEDLLKKVHVSVVPGITYGQDFDGYIRIAFTKRIEVLKVAVERIKQYLENLTIN